MLAHGFFWRHPEIETVVLRPVHIVGPTIKNAPSNYLRLKRPWMLAGFDPMVQLIHMEDVARALRRGAQAPAARASTTWSAPGEVPLSGVFRELGAQADSRAAPARPAAAVDGCFKYRLASFPPEELDHIQFLCMVDGTRWATETGWKPQYSMRETIRSVLGE